MKKQTNIYKEGFNNAYQKLIAYSILNKFDIKKAQKELWEALGIDNRVSFSQYKLGKIEPKAGQAASIEKVFMKYGINESEVWGK
jgi:hypothetical protein